MRKVTCDKRKNVMQNSFKKSWNRPAKNKEDRKKWPHKFEKMFKKPEIRILNWQIFLFFSKYFLHIWSVKRSEGVRAQRAPRRELCERQQLSNPVRFLCTLCTLIQTPEYDQRRPQQCREDRHKQKVSHYLFIFSSWSDTCSMIALRFPLCCLFSVVSQKKKVQSIAAATLPWTLVMDCTYETVYGVRR